MSESQVNKNNLPPELSFKSLLKLCEEGLKDPVLKNYLQVLEVLQQAMTLFSKYLKPLEIKRDIQTLLVLVIQKTQDMK
jgi:hypothetical protein